MKTIAPLSTLLGLFCFSALTADLSVEDSVKRVHAHLIIHDCASALEEAVTALQQNAHSLPLWEAYIKALAVAGQEKEMIQAWRNYQQLNPKAYDNREVLESMAWGTIQQGARSSSPLVRVMALLAAFFGNDSKGVEIIAINLRDPNILIRGVALEVASKLNDAPLCDAVLDMLTTEQCWDVRLAAIKAAGAMEIKKARPLLLKIAASDQSSAEEVGLAVEALVHLMDHPRLSELQKLASSERAGLRLLACELAAEYELEEAVPILVSLTGDTHFEVRAAAILATGVIAPKDANLERALNAIGERLQDPDDRVAVIAAWFMTRCGRPEGLVAFERLIKSPVRDTRLQASVALVSCGSLGLPLMQKAFQLHSDPYVKINLARGLIGQRVQTEQARDVLYDAYSNSSERWMPLEFGIFVGTAPSKVKHDEAMANKPEAVNQVARLEILKLLAITGHPQAQAGIKKLLKEKTWGVSGLASIQLLSEGDEKASDLVTELLKDSDQTVRVQAALVLAMWGRREDAVPVLEASYLQADRETKERILEGLGKIGTPDSIPFLIDRMEESSQTLRLVAAAAIVQVLYN